MDIPQKERSKLYVKQYKELQALLNRKHTAKERKALATNQVKEFIALSEKWSRKREEPK